MKGDHLGELEELVLLAVRALGGDAYGVTVQQTIATASRREPTLGAVYSALERLERKGLLNSHVGAGEPRPGGRRKRFFALTARGRAALEQTRDARSALWSLAEAGDG
jgi:DNA-binding PadR family transcriptional regulator